MVFGIRPEDIHDLEFVPPNIPSARLSAKVDVTELMGNEILLYLVTGKNTFVARVDPRSNFALEIVQRSRSTWRNSTSSTPRPSRQSTKLRVTREPAVVSSTYALQRAG